MKSQSLFQLAITGIVVFGFAASRPVLGCGGDNRQAASCQSRPVAHVKMKPAAASALQTPMKRPPMKMETGEGYRIRGHRFGNDVGQVILEIGGLELDCQVLSWSDGEVTYQIPSLTIHKELQAKMKVRHAMGTTLISKPVRIQQGRSRRWSEVDSLALPEPTIEPLR